MENKFEIWDENVSEKEKKGWKEKLGKYFEKTPYTKYSGDPSSDEILNRVGTEAEVELTEKVFSAKKMEELWEKIEKIDKEIDVLEEKKDKAGDNISLIEILNEEIQKKKAKIKKLVEDQKKNEQQVDNN